MSALLSDLRHSARMLLKNPLLTVTCVVTLSLGVALTTMMFSIINGVLFEQLPYEDARRYMLIWRTNLEEGSGRMGVSIHDFEEWRSRQTSFEDLTGYYRGTVNVTNEGDPPIRFQGAFIVPSVFSLVGVQPQIGRAFTEEEMEPDAPAVLVLSHRVWQNHFGGDPEIVGRTVRANGQVSTIIGVMPEGFSFPDRDDVWLPQRQDSSQIERNQGVWLQVMGKLKEGVTKVEAAAELNVIASSLAEAYPETNENIGALVLAYGESVMDSEGRLLLFLMLAGMFAVLLIACFNVANLLLSRAIVRAREMAIRTSIGATRRRLLSQMLSESMAFAFGGALIGLVLSYYALRVFNRAVQFSEPPWWFNFGIDGTVVLFVVGLMLVSAIVTGVLPALQSTSTNVNEILKGESRGTSSFRMSRFSKGLVIVEIAFSCGLLAVAGLMTKSMLKIGGFDFGIDAEQVFTARVGLFVTDYPTREERIELWKDLRARLSALPDVVSASFTPNLPLEGSSSGSFVVEGEEYPEEAEFPSTRVKEVMPGYFETFGLNVLRGRVIAESDVQGAVDVVVVNESFAANHFPDRDPIGVRVRPANDSEAPWYTIIGVVAD